MPKMDEIMTAVQDTFTVKRVFGEPIVKDGTTVIPVAQVSGGGGGGEGGPEGGAEGTGSGQGFGGSARGIGVFVVKPDGVEWQPAVDVTRLGIAGIALGALFVVMLRGAMRR